MLRDYHGSAEWHDDEGWERETALNGLNLVIGHPKRGSDFSEVEGNLLGQPTKRHLLSVAPTRSGKGVSFIIPNLLQYKGSAIVIDPKGENAWITAQYRSKELGQKTMILDPWGEVNRRYGKLAGELETVARFNPLSILNPESVHYADDIAYLSDALIINQGKDPHWDDSARELVAGLIAYVIEKPEFRDEASLGMVRELLSNPADVLRGFAKDAQSLGPESVASRKLGRFATDSRELNSVISTALTQTAFLDSKTLAQNLEKSDFSFDDLINGRATIYLVLPVDKLQTYGRWLRLMVSIGIRTVARNVRTLGTPVLFILDEFGTIGRLSAVAQAYGLMAGLQMVLWAFVQDLVQLKRDYPDDWETFIGNSEAVTFLSVMDQFTAKYVSDMLGTTTVERISQSTADTREGGFLRSAQPGYGAMADQYFARPLLQPSEVRTTTRTTGIMIGHFAPHVFRPIAYYQDPLFLARARLDPHFPGMNEAKEKARVDKIKAFIETLLPDMPTVKAAFKEQGYKIKEAIFSDKLKVIAPDTKKYVFANSPALFEYLTTLLVNWITMTSEGAAFEEGAARGENATVPLSFLFKP